MSDIVIYHNPKCGTSRNTLALLQDKGLEPQVVEYLKTGWTKAQLQALTKKMGVGAHAILRTMGTEAEALGLTKPDTPDDVLFEAMVKDPILVNRPIVDTPKGAALCRPMERVLDLI